MKGFIVDAAPVTVDSKEYVDLFGRLETGESFVARQEYKPYLFIEEKHRKKAEKVLKKYNVEETKLKNFKGEQVIKIISPLSSELNKLSTYLHEADIPTRLSDVCFLG